MPDPINIGDPQSMTEMRDAGQAAAQAAAQPSVAPVQSAPVIPPPAAPVQSEPAIPPPAAPVSPAAPSATVPAQAATVVDVPVVLPDGRQVPLSEVTAGYEAAIRLGLDDKETNEFVTTVAMAARGDKAALQRVSEMADAINPQPSPVQPTAPSGAVVPTTAAVPGTMQPATAPAAARSSDSALINQTLTEILKPLVDRVSKLEPHVQAEIQTNQLAALEQTFETRKAEFPRLRSGGNTAARRVLEIYNGRVEAARRAGAAVPNQHDLHQMLAAEERYLASAMPAPANPATIVADTDVMGRVPGAPVPGRVHGDPNVHVNQPPVAPSAPQPPQEVSTTMPLTGAPSTVPIAPQDPQNPTTQVGLRAKIDAQLSQLGVRKGQ